MKYKIYVLKHPITKEIRYVGATIKSLNSRLSHHIYSANHRRKTRVSKWIFFLLKTDLFPLIELIEEVDEKNWEEREIYHISKYPNLTNTAPGGKGIIINRSKESINRSIKSKEVRIVQLDKNGDFIKEWNSVKSATKYFKFNSLSSISNVLKKRSPSAAGYYWVYYKDYIENNYTLPIKRSTVDYSKLKKVYIYNKNGDFLKEYSCANKAAIELSPNKKNYTALLKAIKMGYTFKGYYVSYEKYKNYMI